MGAALSSASLGAAIADVAIAGDTIDMTYNKDIRIT
jgi:hypothetical protein